MRAIPTDLPEVIGIEPRVFADERGFLFEAYSARRFRELGIACTFVQFNHSFSLARVVRGLHYQVVSPQAKLVRVVRGRIFDVVADIRRGSPRFGRWVGAELSAENRRQLFVPAGFAHGFCALEEAEVLYAVDTHYAPEHERGIAWDDPELGIRWPVTAPILSARDARLPRLAQVAPADLPLHDADGPR
jgi:dTDP-4-dehydrorhamnose 3,5-epimerase